LLSWCRAQTNTCPLLCTNGQTASNTCNTVSSPLCAAPNRAAKKQLTLTHAGATDNPRIQLHVSDRHDAQHLSVQRDAPVAGVRRLGRSVHRRSPERPHRPDLLPVVCVRQAERQRNRRRHLDVLGRWRLRHRVCQQRCVFHVRLRGRCILFQGCGAGGPYLLRRPRDRHRSGHYGACDCLWPGAVVVGAQKWLNSETCSAERKSSCERSLHKLRKIMRRRHEYD